MLLYVYEELIRMLEESIEITKMFVENKEQLLKRLLDE
jgi:hypothetical protein